MRLLTAYCWKEGTGREKERKNEDSMLLEQVRIGKERILFAAVCDGIGGMQEGEYASGLLAEELKRWFFDEALEIYRKNMGYGKQKRYYKKSFSSRLYHVSEKLTKYGEKKRCRLGTTCSAVFVIGRRYLTFSVGDSFVMKLASHKKKFLNTPDVNEKGQLVRCVGSEGWFPVQYSSGYLRQKEVILLGTDGFLRFLRREDVEELLSQIRKIPVWKKGGNSLRIQKMSTWLETMENRLRYRGEWDDMTAILIREAN